MKKLMLFCIYTILTFLLTEVSAKEEYADTIQVNNEKYVPETTGSRQILFKFAPKRKMFFMDYKGNRKSIQQAAKLIGDNLGAIRRGEMLISVNGYCTSFESEQSNLRMAKNRSNQVKSYYITNHGMKERFYKTTNHTTPYNGDNNIVAMLELIRLDEETSPKAEEVSPTPEPTPDSIPKPIQGAIQETTPKPTDTIAEAIDCHLPTTNDGKVSNWRIKTNLPYYAAVIPNLAVEWRFKDHWSLDVPIFYMPFTVKLDYRFRTFTVQPSVRYWLRDDWKGHFFGIHATGGRYNVATKNDYRYQDINGMWGGGLDYGYALSFAKHWGMEFNIGAGLIYSKYEIFYNINNGAVRSYPHWKAYWGITRLGISIFYNI